MKERNTFSSRRLPISFAVSILLILFGLHPANADEIHPDTVLAVENALAVMGQDSATENPDVTLPTDHDRTARLETAQGDLAFQVPSNGSVEDSTSSGIILEGKDNTTSVAVESTEFGLRALIHIESRKSPERFEFPVTGDVSSLVLEDDGSVLALNADGELIAAAAPAWAVDRMGKRVPTHFEIEGSTLIQVIKHRDRRYSYGIVADPAWGVVFAAAARMCAGGALAGVSSTVLLDIYKGKKSSKKTYVENAIASCLVTIGGGSVAIALKSKTIRKWAVNSVIWAVLKIRRW